MTSGLGAAAASRPLHLRPRGDGAEQPTTAVELFFDLVFVFAITQLSDLVLDDLTVSGLLRAGFLLLVVWWAWINTTWLANWLDPGSTRVRLVLVAGALVSLLLSRRRSRNMVCCSPSPASACNPAATSPRPSWPRPVTAYG